MAHIHTLAEKNFTQLSADVSITAKSFFEVNDFEILKQKSVPIRGQVLTNFKMIKTF
jgi:putative acetyltransferase